MSRARVWLIAVLIAPLTAACDNGPAAPTATTAPTVVVSPVTETFTTQLAVGGSSSRTFTAAKAGTATATLTSLDFSPTLKVGFGIGIPDVTGSACLFTQSMETSAGGQLSASVDPGVYCVRVYDLGTLASTINFTVTIVRP